MPINTATTTLQRWLRDYCSQSAMLTGCVVVTSTQHGEHTRILAEWPERNDINQSLIDAGMIALKRNSEGIVVPPIVQSADGPQRIVEVLLNHAHERCIIVLGVKNPNDSVAQGYLNDLRSLKGRLEELLKSADNLNAALSATLLNLQLSLLGPDRLDVAAAALTNEVANTYRFDRCSLGLIEDGRIRVAAVSHGAMIEQRQALLRKLAAAMEEAIDQAVTLTQPPRPDETPFVLLAHAEFAARAGTCLASIPIGQQGKLIGVLTVERRGTQPPAREEVAQCEHLAALIAPILNLRMQAERSLLQRAREQLRQHWQQFATADNRRARLAGGLVALLAALALFIPLPYRLAADARLEGLEQRLLVAPNDGFLKQVHVRPGDTVRTGQLLAEMADQDLRLEEGKWQAELSQHENAYIAAMARTDRAAFSISRAKANEAAAQLELVRSHLDRMHIVAPMDGIVVQGDLTQSLGAPVRRGDTLLTLAPRGRHRLIIDIDERDIGDVSVGRPGSLALSALPETPVDFTVERIVPVAVTRDGRNLFEVEAKLANELIGLRPGLQGIAKLEIESRSLAWQLAHRIVDWVRLRLFAWGL